MKITINGLSFALLLKISLLFLVSSATAQPGAFNPPLADCGRDGIAELICGTRAPEDFELTPDGNYLVVAEYGAVTDPALELYNLATGEFTELDITEGKKLGWGENTCYESIGHQVSPHGLSLTRRSSGEWQLYVVNHNVRESMEMYELRPLGFGWELIWRGCVMAEEPYNDVAALPDGSFVATRPQAIVSEGQDLFAGEPTGNVAIWTADNGEQVLNRTEYGFPNGVVVSDNGKYAYISGWTTLDFHKYDLVNQREVAHIDLGFMPDNLTWTSDGKILAAGIPAVAGNCPADSENPCLQGMKVAEIDPETMQFSIIGDNNGRAWINGTSVAIEADGYIYVGSFQGTRMVKLPR